MKKFAREADVMDQPIDKIDKNLRHIFGLLVEKDWKTAASLIKKIGEGDDASKQMAGGFQQLLDFLKVFTAGKDLKASSRRLDSIIIKDELENLLPKMDDEDLAALKADITEKGILAPLVVQDTPDGLLLVDGYTRYRIAEELGLGRVPVVSAGDRINAEVLAIALNMMRRHMDKATRHSLIQKIPVPRAGRPKKGEEVISKAELARELGVSESTIKRARREKRGQNDQNEPFSKKKKLPKICTPPDSKEEVKSLPEWINPQDFQLDTLERMGRLKSMGFALEFTKDQIDLDFMIGELNRSVETVLAAVKKAGLEEKVGKYRMTVSFEARKREEK